MIGMARLKTAKSDKLIINLEIACREVGQTVMGVCI